MNASIEKRPRVTTEIMIMNFFNLDPPPRNQVVAPYSKNCIVDIFGFKNKITDRKFTQSTCLFCGL